MKNLLKSVNMMIFFVILLTLTLSCEEKQTKKETSEDVEFLIVQNADSVMMNDGKLRLKTLRLQHFIFPIVRIVL